MRMSKCEQNFLNVTIYTSHAITDVYQSNTNHFISKCCHVIYSKGGRHGKAPTSTNQRKWFLFSSYLMKLNPTQPQVKNLKCHWFSHVLRAVMWYFVTRQTRTNRILHDQTYCLALKLNYLKNGCLCFLELQVYSHIRKKPKCWTEESQIHLGWHEDVNKW